MDIGNESHYVAVPPSRNSQPVRRFGCTTADLKAMADWLKQCGIRTVAMQSTGVYWIAVYDILDQRHPLCWHLATMRAVKYTPQGEVLGNVLELMLGPRSHEQEVARLELVPLAVVNECSLATNDEVNLVLCMRHLLARAQGEAKGYVKSATLQDHDGALARGTRNTRFRLREV